MFTGPDAIGDRAGNAAYARGDRYDAFTRDDWPKLTEAEQTAFVKRAFEWDGIDDDELSFAIVNAAARERYRERIVKLAQGIAFDETEDGR